VQNNYIITPFYVLYILSNPLVHQLQDEKKKLQEENERLESETTDLKKEVDDLKVRLEETEWGLCQKSGELAHIKSQLKDTQVRYYI